MGLDPYIGQVQPYAGPYPPRGWAFCQGQFLPIDDYQALYAIIGSIYGGDDRTVFRLPDLRGRAVVGAGQGPGLTPRYLGQFWGFEDVALDVSALAKHNHDARVEAVFTGSAVVATGQVAEPANGDVPAASFNATHSAEIKWYGPTGTNDVALQGVVAQDTVVLDDTGGDQWHPNMQPWSTVNYIIAVEGLFPPRS